MPRLSLGDHCTHRGEIARVIGVRGARRLITFGHDDVDAVWVPIEELRPQGSVGLSPETLALLARVPHVVRDRAETIASCIERIRESVTSGRRGPALRQQLHVQGIEVSERQCYRYLRRYSEGGIAALIDGRWLLEQGSRRAVSEAVLTMLAEELGQQRLESIGTRSRILKRVSWRAADAGLALPSRSTLYRALYDLALRSSDFGSTSTRKTEVNRPDRSFRRLTVTRPGEVVEMDSTVLDVMVRMPDGSIRRPELTYAVDVATWSILGTLVMPKTSRGTDLGATVLGLSLLRPQDRPGWKNVTASLEDIFGTTGEWRDQLEAAAVGMPRIVPESITVDRGKNFTSVAFAAACRAMEISQVFANPRTPTDKPHVESGFRSIRLGFVQFLAGYTGGSLNKRGVNLESSAVWTLAELRALLEFWVLAEWQNTPQSGLRMSSAPQQLLTPNQMFAALGGIEPGAQTGGLEFEQYLGLLPIVWRTVQPYGVNVHGFTYDSERVHPYRGQRSGLSGEANGRWEIRVDATCPDRVWFRDHRNREWLELNRVTPLAARPVLGSAETAVPAIPTRAFDLVRAIHEVQSARIAAKPLHVSDTTEPSESSVAPLRLLPREEPLPTDQVEHTAAQASVRRLRVLE